MCVTLVSFLSASAGLKSVAGASTLLATVVSQQPEKWTPNVSGGPVVGGYKPYCSETYFGQGSLECQSEVYDTAFVNGEVVVVGAFADTCEPGPLHNTPVAQCANNANGTTTQVKRNDIFAYQAGTGLIDPNFVPVLNAGPAWTVVAGPNNTVYVGGVFTTVNGTASTGLVQLNVDPGVTTGANPDGSIYTTGKTRVSAGGKPAFVASINTTSYGVRDLALSPDSTALYVGGQFSSVDGVGKFTNGTKVDGLARLNASTGALDQSFAIGVSGAVDSTDPIKIDAMALSPDGTHLAFSGAFLDVSGATASDSKSSTYVHERLAIVDTGGTYGGFCGSTCASPATLSDFTAPILTNNCSKQHDYVRGLDFSPDGTFIVVADTGLNAASGTPYAICDAVGRFNVNAADTTSTGKAVDVPPAWVDYAGADSFYSVAIAGDVVYVGGHDRWANNFCGNNYVCGPNAIYVGGLTAMDANTGIALAWWHPTTLRGDGTMYLSTFPQDTYLGPGTAKDPTPAGLALGTDVDLIGGMEHSENALFPMSTTTPLNPGGPIPSGMFNEEGGSLLTNPLCIDDAANSTKSGAKAQLNTCTNYNEQNFSVVPTTTPLVEMIQIGALCLDTAGSVTTSPANVVLNTCNPRAPTQQWTQGPNNTLVNVGATAATAATTTGATTTTMPSTTPICLTDPKSSTTLGVQLDITECITSPSTPTNQVWPLPSADGPPPPPPTGLVYSEEKQANGDVPCLDDTGDSTATGNPVQISACTGTTEQNWTVSPDSSDTSSFSIELVVTTGATKGTYCLDSPSATLKGAVTAVLNPCNVASTTQQWTATPAGIFNSFQLGNTGLSTLNKTPYCLIDPGAVTTNGTRLQIATCATSKSQPLTAEQWRLPAV